MKTGGFLDTNVLVYAADLANPDKQDRAIELIKAALVNKNDYAISIQALTEFVNVALKKLKMAPEVVLEYLTFYEALNTILPDRPLVRRGVEIKALYGIQYYDAMMIAAAERAGMREILTEDLNEGQLYCGIRAHNPFSDAAALR